MAANNSHFLRRIFIISPKNYMHKTPIPLTPIGSYSWFQRHPCVQGASYGSVCWISPNTQFGTKGTQASTYIRKYSNEAKTFTGIFKNYYFFILYLMIVHYYILWVLGLKLFSCMFCCYSNKCKPWCWTKLVCWSGDR